MKERMTTAVSPGEVLQVHTSKGPIGKPVTVPDGVTSLTIVFRDAKGAGAGREKKKDKGAGKRDRTGGAAKQAKDKWDDDED